MATRTAPPSSAELPQAAAGFKTSVPSAPATTTGSAASTCPRPRPVLHQSVAAHRPAALRGGPLDPRGHRQGARRRPRRGAELGHQLARRIGPTSSTASPTGWSRTSRPWPLIETIDNGKPIRETTRGRPAPRRSTISATSPARIRAQEGSICEIDARHRRLSLPRAARRRGPDHPVELPAADGDLEARAGARGGELRRAQAGRADAGVHPGVHGADRRHPAERRGQRGPGLRRRGRQAARPEPARRQDRLHRRDHDRPPRSCSTPPRT